ncbi:SDR family oxidoreductase [Pseudaestuariivita sp.]|uniref:SDR family oxidoreductase n=1 Tax=Pseudaestuariivita sp. TaxID=2211669 RepID=UPI004059C77A
MTAPTPMPDLQPLAGRYVVVLGGGSGMGRATAGLAARQGAEVTLASRTAAKLDAAARSMPGNVHTAPVDMTDESCVRRWAAGLGPVDHLIISASSAVHGPFAEVATDDVRAMFEAKFFGPYVAAREVLPYIVKGGSITLFSGVLSRRPGAGATALGAVNAAVEGLVRGLALELGADVRVNGVSPGMVETEAYAALPEDRRQAMYAETGKRLPIGRIGQPEELAPAILLAATNTYMNGHVMDIDGGHMVRQ